jgi:nucleolar protein 16
VQRYTSTGEQAYLLRLVERYGTDVEAMSHDRRLNIEQKSAGQLSRALRKAGLVST